MDENTSRCSAGVLTCGAQNNRRKKPRYNQELEGPPQWTQLTNWMSCKRFPNNVLANKQLQTLIQNLGLSDIQAKGQYLNF